MKKIIILSFLLIFSLFSLGSGIVVSVLFTTTSKLHYLIDMHEVEDIRQDLRVKVEKIRTFIFAPPAVFADHLDEVVATSKTLNNTLTKCSSCHHRPEVLAEIDDTRKMVSTFEERLSFFITTVADENRRGRLREDIAGLSDAIVLRVENMAERAALIIASRTEQAIRGIDRSYKILGVILAVTFAMALWVARFVTLRITRPIDALLCGARRIADGKEGFAIDFQAGAEFGELIATFNEMSTVLARRRDQIKEYLRGLTKLNSISVSLHAARAEHDLVKLLGPYINNLLDVEESGVMVRQDVCEAFALHWTSAQDQHGLSCTVDLPLDRVLASYRANMGQFLLTNTMELDEALLPFAKDQDDILPRNLLLVWLIKEDTLLGALLAVNKKNGFSAEDANLLGIIASNVTVALDNIRLYQDLEERMGELNKTQRQLIEAEKLTAIGTLAGGVAHDFNNILCGIIGYATLLKRTRSPEDREYQILTRVEQAGLRASSLTKQLLAFARQDRGQAHPLCLNESVSNVLALFQTTISKLISVSLELAADLPAVKGDAAQLEQVIMNLCVNARDAMPEGGKLVVRTECVTVDAAKAALHKEARAGTHLKLSVSDSGMGIDEAIMPRIFEPFFTTKEIGKGTGLGLAMVYGIVTNHGGFCEVKSSPGQGSDFSVYLPAANISKQPEPEVKALIPKGEGTVLIIDDEVMLHSMLAEYLQDLGYKTLLSRNGVEALMVMQEHKDEVGLALLDINMPVMGGKTAFFKLREIKPGLKVLVSSGYALNSEVREILDHGGDGFIQKPYKLEALAQSIHKTMTGHKAMP